MILGIPKRLLIIVAVLVGVGLIYLTGAEKRASQGAPGGGGAPAACRMTVTADMLNVRSSPQGGAPVVGHIAHNAETGAETEVQNGFRKLAENQWASSEFLQPVAGAPCG